MIVGLLITGAIAVAVVKGGVNAALHPCGERQAKKEEDEKPLLRKEEE